MYWWAFHVLSLKEANTVSLEFAITLSWPLCNTYKSERNTSTFLDYYYSNHRHSSIPWIVCYLELSQKISVFCIKFMLYLYLDTLFVSLTMRDGWRAKWKSLCKRLALSDLKDFVYFCLRISRFEVGLHMQFLLLKLCWWVGVGWVWIIVNEEKMIDIYAYTYINDYYFSFLLFSG